jgi:hypothetical protein
MGGDNVGGFCPDLHDFTFFENSNPPEIVINAYSRHDYKEGIAESG